MDKYIGKVVLIEIPNVARPRYRWIVRKRDDGRYMVRTPKIGTLIRELNLLRDIDFGKETALPKGAKVRITKGRSRRKGGSKKNKTVRKH